MGEERFLVTGATGCIGSWVVRNLVREGTPVAALARRRAFNRLRLILSDAELEAVAWIDGDITDVDALEAASREHGVTTLVHLAALQFPFCAADPLAGARVNVAGTVAMFELARRLGIGRLVYASSAAVYGPKTHYAEEVLPPDAPFFPTSHYGVYKVANEGTAKVYWEANGVSSVALRPHSVYGPGRDQGVTSKPTVAMIAAAARRPYRIPFGGRAQFQFADDVAKTFVAAARSTAEGAFAFSLPGPRFGVGDMVSAIEAVEPAARGTISFGGDPLAFPEAFDGAALENALGPQQLTPLEDGVRRTIDCYRAAIADGRVAEAFLDRVVAPPS